MTERSFFFLRVDYYLEQALGVFHAWRQICRVLGDLYFVDRGGECWWGLHVAISLFERRLLSQGVLEEWKAEWFSINSMLCDTLCFDLDAPCRRAKVDSYASIGSARRSLSCSSLGQCRATSGSVQGLPLRQVLSSPLDNTTTTL